MAVSIDKELPLENPWIYEIQDSLEILMTSRALCLRKKGQALTLMDEELKRLKNVLSQHPLQREG